MSMNATVMNTAATNAIGTNAKAASLPSASAFDFEAYARRLETFHDGYVCPRCHGQGFFLAENANVAYTCSCRPMRATLAQLRRQGLDHAARTMTFLSYDAAEPWQRQMLSAALAYVSQEKPGWLFFGGQSGCGKTHLGTAAAVALSLHGQELCYMPWSREASLLKTLATDERRGELMQRFIDAPVLYIDDLFKAPPTEADKHLAFELLCARYIRDDRPTIISSERTLADLIAIDEAIAGRIAERCGRDFAVSIARDMKKNHRFAGLL